MNLPIIDMAATGKNIERLRRENHLKISDVQKIFGFASPQAIYYWERGRSLPSLDNLLALAAIFHCRIDEIIITVNDQPRG